MKSVISICTLTAVLIVYSQWLALATAARLGSPVQEAETCGAKALYIALSALGRGPGRYRELARSLGPTPSGGYSLLELESEAKRWECDSASVSLTEHQLRSLVALPATEVILLLEDPAHFVNCSFDQRQQVQVVESTGLQASLDTVISNERWSGSALVIARDKVPAIDDESTTAKYFAAFGVGIGILTLSFLGLRKLKR